MTPTEIMDNKYVQMLGAAALGFFLHVLISPSKTETKTLETKHQEEMSKLAEQSHIQFELMSSQVNETEAKYKSLQQETTKTIASLRSENVSLRLKSRSQTLKIVKPDGTVIEKSVLESDSESTSQVLVQVQEEFKTKIAEIESKWTKIHYERVDQLQSEYSSKEAEYKKEIEELKSKTVTVTNEKKLGLEAGYSLDKSVYGHATYDFSNPLFFGGHLEKNKEDYDAAVGLGVRF